MKKVNEISKKKVETTNCMPKKHSDYCAMEQKKKQFHAFKNYSK